LKNKFTLPQLAWHGVKRMEIILPDNWQVQACNMAGYDRPALSAAALKKAVCNPCGMPPLREYARDKKEVVIIFDDMTRVTRIAGIVPHVLKELTAAGIKDKQIRFIGASGCHGAMDRIDFAKKLGEDVLKRFPVYNHSPFTNTVYAGTTRNGIKVHINAEVMACDLKIGIGSIVPHIMAGFGGGGKLILPGVAAYQTIVALHSLKEGRNTKNFSNSSYSMGKIAGNVRRRPIDDAVGLVGLDMKIDALVNMWGETTELFAGAPGEEYAAALRAAKTHYLTPQAKNMDVIFANSYAKASEAISGLPIAYASLKESGGDIVLIANAPEGQATHYLMGPFGNSIAGKLQLQMKVPDNVNRLIIYNEYPELASGRFLEDSGKIIMMDDWTEVMALLKQSHKAGTKAAIYPNADIQY
jgi:lactate racemase